MNGDFYNLVNKINSLTEEAPVAKKTEKDKTVLKEGAEQLGEKYMGFKKTVASIKKGGSAENPEAVAANIGRDKYGKERFQKAAAAGKKLGEQGVAEEVDTGQYDARKKESSSKKEQDKVFAKHRERMVKLRKEMDDENKKQGVAEGEVDESGLQAYLGKKKYGPQGMKALQKAGREGASKKELAKIKAEYIKNEDATVMVDPRQVTGTATKPPTLQPELKLPEPKQSQPMVKPATTPTGTPERPVNEKAPPGAKAERMVKHIKAGYAKDGKLTDVEQRKAFGAAWKAHNAGKVEENKVFTESFFRQYNKHKTINSLIVEAFDDNNGISIEEKDLKSYIGDKLYTELQQAISGEGDLSDDLIDMLFDYYDQKGELPPEIVNNEMSVISWLTNKAKTIIQQQKQAEPEQAEPTDQTQPVKEAADTRKVSGRRYGGSSQEDDEDEDEEGNKKSKAEPEVKRGRGRPAKAGSQSTSPEEKRKQKDREEAGKALQSMIVGNQPKKASKELGKLPATKHKMKG